MSDLEINNTYALVDTPLNRKLIAELKEKGAEIMVFPALKTSPAELPAAALERLLANGGYDWLVLTDVFAADYFIEALREQQADFFALDEISIAVLGEAVADRLRFVQIHADIIPSKATDEAILDAISGYAGGFSGLRLLILREYAARFGFIEKLAEEQAFVEELPAYRAAFEESAEIVRMRTLLQGGAVDEFVFSSAEDVIALKLLCATDDLTQFFKETKTSALNEIAYQTLQENGFRPLYFHHR